MSQGEGSPKLFTRVGSVHKLCQLNFSLRSKVNRNFESNLTEISYFKAKTIGEVWIIKKFNFFSYY